MLLLTACYILHLYVIFRIRHVIVLHFWLRKVAKHSICYEKVCPSICPSVHLSVALVIHT